MKDQPDDQARNAAPSDSRFSLPAAFPDHRGNGTAGQWKTTISVAAIAALTGALCYWLKGPDTVIDILRHEALILVDILLRIVGGMVLAGSLILLLPLDRLKAWLSGQAMGARLALATGFGALTPDISVVFYTLAATLAIAGIDKATIVAYVSACLLLSVFRVMIWEAPLLGFDFAGLRLLVCLPLPIVAGLLVSWLFPAGRRQPTSGAP